MSAESDLAPPQLHAGVQGSMVTLNWTHEDLGDRGWHELTELVKNTTWRTRTNGQSLYLPDGEWTFRVKVIHEDGRSSISNEVQVSVDTSSPGIPELRIRNDGIVVTLDWDTVPNAVSYEIICNSAWIGNVAGPPDALAGVHFAHHAWHDGVYNYQVRARNTAGRWSAFSSPVTHIVDTAPPDAPVVKVSAEGLRVLVRWNKPSGKPESYAIRCNGEDVGTTTQTWFDIIVDEAGPYSFRVRTVDSEGRESAWSEVTEHSAVLVGYRR